MKNPILPFKSHDHFNCWKSSSARITSSLVFFCFWLWAYPQNTIKLTPIQDNTLYESLDGDVSNGLGGNLFVGQNGMGDLRRAALLFDFSAELPSNPAFIVDSVSLTLYVSRANQQSDTAEISLHRALASWGEGISEQTSLSAGQGVAAEDGDVTWIHRFFPDTLWDEIGGDFIVDPSSTALVSNETEQFVSWTGEGLINDVQFWLDNPGENFGWIMVGNEGENEVQSTRGFHTKDIDDPNLSPTLFISFSPVTSNLNQLEGFNISVYPNPSQGIVNLSVNNIQTKDIEVTVRNLIGNQVRQYTFDTHQNSILTTLDLSELSSGIYFLQFSAAHSVETRKIVIR